MPTNTYTGFHARIVQIDAADVVVEKVPVHLTDDYLAFMQRKIDAEKPENFKLTPTSPSGW